MKIKKEELKDEAAPKLMRARFKVENPLDI